MSRKLDYYGRIRARWDKEAKDNRESMRRYGYHPALGFAPVIVFAAISLTGLVLAWFFTWGYLIMYGIALILMILSFWAHTFPDSQKHGFVSSGYISERGLIRLIKIWKVFRIVGQVMLYGSFFLATHTKDYIFVSFLLGSIIILVSFHFIGKRIQFLIPDD